MPQYVSQYPIGNNFGIFGNSINNKCKRVAFLKSIISAVDGGPLSLQELARIAIRSLIGGFRFATRVYRLPLPPQVVEYLKCSF